MKVLPAAVLAAAALALGACGCSSSDTSASSAPGGGSGAGAAASTSTIGGNLIEVSIQRLSFSPATVHTKVGRTVHFTNNDSPPHNVTYVSGPKFGSSATLNPGDSFSIKLKRAGTIHYFCSIHTWMTGTIIVSG